MAITQKNKNSLVESQVVKAPIAGTGPTVIESSKSDVKTVVTKVKKVSFLGSVLAELKLVKWPSLQYVLKWSGLVILFTGVFSLVLGGADHVFESGITFVNCTSPKGKARDLPTCSQDLVKDLFFVAK